MCYMLFSDAARLVEGGEVDICGKTGVATFYEPSVVSISPTQDDSSKYPYLVGRKSSLEFKFCYFADHKFTKF